MRATVLRLNFAARQLLKAKTQHNETEQSTDTEQGSRCIHRKADTRIIRVTLTPRSTFQDEGSVHERGNFVHPDESEHESQEVHEGQQTRIPQQSDDGQLALRDVDPDHEDDRVDAHPDAKKTSAQQ